MKNYILLIIVAIVAFACVPAKKYNDLLAKEKACAEELTKFKSSSIDYEGRSKTLDAENKILIKEIFQLKLDTTDMGNKYRMLAAEYDKANERNQILETQFDAAKMRGAKETAVFQADLESKILEVQRKEDALLVAERELAAKQKLLLEREARVKELEELIARQEMAVKALKDKIALALRGFQDKGLTVVQKDGKVYVSLEAKLLFPSGSTNVEAEGKTALIQLAKALEGETDMEIVVEGHTDSDALSRNSHPKSNWELSVLRATSVLEIMTKNSSIDPKILTAAGRSEYHPIDENDKAKNRRIEVIIAPNLSALFEILNK